MDVSQTEQTLKNLYASKQNLIKVCGQRTEPEGFSALIFTFTFPLVCRSWK